MKRLGVLFSVLFLCIFTLLQSSGRKKPGHTKSKHEGEVDEEIKGPGGEDVYVGSGGGRYFIRNNRKIFVAYKRQ